MQRKVTSDLILYLQSPADEIYKYKTTLTKLNIDFESDLTCHKTWLKCLYQVRIVMVFASEVK